MANATSTYAPEETTGWAAQRTAVTTALFVSLRIGAGLLFMQHGAQKLFGWFGGFGGTPGATADLFSLMGLAGVLEFFGGALVALGLFTTPVAAILVLLMLSAFFMAHVPQGWVPIQNGGEMALLFALIFAFVASRGSGPLSLDRRLGRRLNRQ